MNDTMIDFDVRRTWESDLTSALSEHVLDALVEQLAAVAPESVQESLGVLLACTDQKAVVNAAEEWI